MTDDRWKTTFAVVRKEERVEDGDLGSHFKTSFNIVNIHNDVLVGNYETESYAIKQARRKYKKLVKLMEKSFMSVT